MTHGFLLRCSFPSISVAASATAVLEVVIMLSISMSSSLSPMSGANFPPIVARKLQAASGSLSYLRSKLSLGWFDFLAAFRRTRKVNITRSWSLPMSVQGKLLVLWMLTPARKRLFTKKFINLDVVFPIWAVPCPSSGLFVRAKGVCQY